MLALFEGEERYWNHKMEINIFAASIISEILQFVTCIPEKINLRVAMAASHNYLIWKWIFSSRIAASEDLTGRTGLKRKVPNNFITGPMAHQVGEGDTTSLHLLTQWQQRNRKKALSQGARNMTLIGRRIMTIFRPQYLWPKYFQCSI